MKIKTGFFKPIPILCITCTLLIVSNAYNIVRVKEARYELASTELSLNKFIHSRNTKKPVAGGGLPTVEQCAIGAKPSPKDFNNSDLGRDNIVSKPFRSVLWHRIFDKTKSWEELGLDLMGDASFINEIAEIFNSTTGTLEKRLMAENLAELSGRNGNFIEREIIELLKSNPDNQELLHLLSESFSNKLSDEYVEVLRNNLNSYLLSSPSSIAHTIDIISEYDRNKNGVNEMEFPCYFDTLADNEDEQVRTALLRSLSFSNIKNQMSFVENSLEDSSLLVQRGAIDVVFDNGLISPRILARLAQIAYTDKYDPDFRGLAASAIVGMENISDETRLEFERLVDTL